jgi:hypothetical protein
MQPARRRRITDGFANGHGERDDVVLYMGFDFIDARGVDLGARSQGHGRFFRHKARFGQRIGRGKLDLKPLGVLVDVAPDAAHFRAGVSSDQAGPLLEIGETAHFQSFIIPQETRFRPAPPVITYPSLARLG